MTHNEVRQRGYWIIGGTSAVSYLVSRCVICRKLRSSHQQQKLADLLQDRVEPAAPFTYSAVDYFGPFLLRKGGRKSNGTALFSRAWLHVLSTLKQLTVWKQMRL